MDAIRLTTLIISIGAHALAGWLLLVEMRGSANDAGSGTDQFLLERGIGIEGIVTFGDAMETVTETQASPPVAHTEEAQPKEVKAETPPTAATTESPDTAAVAKEVETKEEVRTQEAKAVPAQAEEVEQQSSSVSQSGGLATTLSAYYGSVSRAFERHRTKPATRRAGVAVVRFSLEPSGRVISREIERSSGSAMLDNAALASVDRASPLPPVPPEIVASRPLTFSVPFNFIVR